VTLVVLVGIGADEVGIGFGAEDKGVVVIDISIHPLIMGDVDEIREAEYPHC